MFYIVIYSKIVNNIISTFEMMELKNKLRNISDLQTAALCSAY